MRKLAPEDDTVVVQFKAPRRLKVSADAAAKRGGGSLSGWLRDLVTARLATGPGGSLSREVKR